ncbi:hypothetical protein ACROYT_G011545 [Oculina patagonica]
MEVWSKIEANRRKMVEDLVNFLILGTHNSFGSFFVALLQEFKRSEAETAWIGSLAMGITYMAAPITTSLCDRWGCRVVMCLGSVTYMAAMLLTSLVPHMSLMYITYGVMFGFGSSCCYFSSFYILVVYFNKHLALANGIAAAGAGAGTMSVSLTVDKLISTFGLRMTFQCMAGLSVILFLAGLTFLPIDFREGDDDFFKKKALMEEQMQKKTKDKFISSIKRLLKPAPVWGNKAFVAWTVALAMTLIAYYIPYMYLVRLAEGIGIPSTQGALLVGYFALAQTVGKIFFGKLGDSSRVSRLSLTQIALLVIAVAACLCPLARSHSALLTYSLVSGLFDGCLCVMIGLVTHDIVGRQMMAKAVGTMYGIVAIPMTVGPPMAGLLFDSTGNYNIVFFLASGLVIGGSCVMFLIPNLLPSKLSVLKVFTPEIIVSAPHSLNNEDDHDDFVENEKAIVRSSHVSFKSFADQFEVDRSRLLLDRSPNLSSRPSSFVLFSIVPEGSFRDLSQSNERYSNSREASYTSLARLSEIRVESRVNSCARLEPVEEAETSDSCVSSECLDVIIEPRPAETELVVTSQSCDSIDESASHVKAIDEKSDHNEKDSVPHITVSISTESGFASEESVASSYDTKEFVSSATNLSENRLSAYSWNSTGSDLSWKTQCSEAGTEDSGYAEEVTPCLAEDKFEGLLSGHKDSINTYFSQDNLKSDLINQSSNCHCDKNLDATETNTEFSSFVDYDVEHAHSKKEGPLIIDPGPSDYFSELLESQLEDQTQCACGKDKDEFVGKLVSDAKETLEQKELFIADLPQPPDIYSQLFEGILEEVNEYVDTGNFSEFSNCCDSLKTWPKVSMTDLKSCERETVV